MVKQAVDNRTKSCLIDLFTNSTPVIDPIYANIVDFYSDLQSENVTYRDQRIDTNKLFFLETEQRDNIVDRHCKGLRCDWVYVLPGYTEEQKAGDTEEFIKEKTSIEALDCSKSKKIRMITKAAHQHNYYYISTEAQQVFNSIKDQGPTCNDQLFELEQSIMNGLDELYATVDLPRYEGTQQSYDRAVDSILKELDGEDLEDNMILISCITYYILLDWFRIR